MGILSLWERRAQEWLVSAQKQYRASQRPENAQNILTFAQLLSRSGQQVSASSVGRNAVESLTPTDVKTSRPADATTERPSRESLNGRRASSDQDHRTSTHRATEDLATKDSSARRSTQDTPRRDVGSDASARQDAALDSANVDVDRVNIVSPTDENVPRVVDGALSDRYASTDTVTPPAATTLPTGRDAQATTDGQASVVPLAAVAATQEAIVSTDDVVTDVVTVHLVASSGDTVLAAPQLDDVLKSFFNGQTPLLVQIPADSDAKTSVNAGVVTSAELQSSDDVVLQDGPVLVVDASNLIPNAVLVPVVSLDVLADWLQNNVVLPVQQQTFDASVLGVDQHTQGAGVVSTTSTQGQASSQPASTILADVLRQLVAQLQALRGEHNANTAKVAGTFENGQQAATSNVVDGGEAATTLNLRDFSTEEQLALIRSIQEAVRVSIQAQDNALPSAQQRTNLASLSVQHAGSSPLIQRDIAFADQIIRVVLVADHADANVAVQSSNTDDRLAFDLNPNARALDVATGGYGFDRALADVLRSLQTRSVTQGVSSFTTTAAPTDGSVTSSILSALLAQQSRAGAQQGKDASADSALSVTSREGAQRAVVKGALLEEAVQVVRDNYGSARLDVATTSSTSGDPSSLSDFAQGREFSSFLRFQSSATSRAQPEQPTSNGLRQGEPAEQVFVNIRRMVARGQDRIDIRMNPEELGRIRINVQLDAMSRLVVRVTSENKETDRLLKSEAEGLLQSLRQIGFDVNSDDLQFNLKEQQNQRDDQERKGARKDLLVAGLDEDIPASTGLQADETAALSDDAATSGADVARDSDADDATDTALVDADNVDDRVSVDGALRPLRAPVAAESVDIIV